jgi:hypothetical protein
MKIEARKLRTLLPDKALHGLNSSNFGYKRYELEISCCTVFIFDTAAYPFLDNFY